MKIKQLKNAELEKIQGGEVATIWVALGISSLVIFICGVIEGITNPTRCNQ